MTLKANKPRGTPTCENKMFPEAQPEHAVVVHQCADCSNKQVEMKMDFLCHNWAKPPVLKLRWGSDVKITSSQAGQGVSHQ